MHKKLVTNIVSRIVLVVCCIMLAPLGWAVYDDPKSAETTSFLITIAVGILLAGSHFLVFRIRKVDYERINAKDGLAVVGISWIALSVLGALPLYLSHVVPSYTDAFFEIASGFTTTGATIFTDVEIVPRGILFWRSLTHWLGGMGIIVLYLALLPALGINASQLYRAEAPGLSVERVEPKIAETAKVLWGIYFLFTFVETILLLVGGMPIFDALCHTFGTVATGGFSTKNASIGAYDPYIQWVIISFMFLAGINFLLHYLVLTGRLNAYFKQEEFRNYFLIIIILTPIFAWSLMRTGLTESPIRDSVFQIVAILTTTGYTTANFDAWPHTLRLTLLLLMFFGACGGSTGGGMKIARVLLSAKIAIRSVTQSIFPNIVMPIKFNAKILSDKMVKAVLNYFVIFIFLFFMGAIAFTITESCDLVTAFSASIAALSNIGPGLGLVGASENYAWVSPAGKWLLVFLMLAGRLELYSILILLMPSTWRK